LFISLLNSNFHQTPVDKSAFSQIEYFIMFDLEKEISKTLLSWQAGQEVGPTILEFYPTQKCNLTCRTCLQSQSYDKNSFELPDDEFARIIREAIELGTKIFYIGGGGEPFCRRDLVLQLMRMIKKEGCHGSLTSNTTLLQERDVEMMVKIEWDNIHLSIDGPDTETCDYLRGDGTFDKAVRVLKWMSEYKKKYNKTAPFLTFNFVISKKNYRSIIDYLYFAKENRANSIFFNSMIMHSMSFKYLQLTGSEKEAVRKIIPPAIRLAKELGLVTNLAELGYSSGRNPENKLGIKILANRFFSRISSLLRKTGKNQSDIIDHEENSKMCIGQAYCLKPWYHLVLQTNGVVGPCCIFQDSGESLYKHSLKNAWLNSYFPALRREMLSTRPPGNCIGCPAVLREEDAVLKKCLLQSELDS